MQKFRQKIQDKINSLSEKSKERFSFWYSFAESFLLVLPPPDFFLIYTIFTNTKSWFKYTKLMIFGSVIGGALSYLFGYFFFVWFGDWFLSFNYIANEFNHAAELFNKNAFWAIFLAGLTPIPYTVFTIAAGVFKANFFIFIIASLISRGLRFMIVGLVSFLLGKRFATLFMRYFDLVAVALVIAVIVYIFLKF